MAVGNEESGNGGVSMQAQQHTSAIVIDQHHPLFLQPSDTPGSSLISIKLTGPENYALWSSSMRISLLGKSKLGFVDGRYTKDKFESSLHDLWEKCNAIVLSWIMNSVSTELLGGMVYATSAYKVWTDLRETFDKVSGSRVLLLHKQIATLTQGIASISTYFSKLKELWAEFDALMPCPGCGCEESRKYVEHFEYQRLLQFLMGLNESYAQSSNQMLMMVPVPSINKAYSMIISEESRRSLTPSNAVSDVCEGAALFSHKGGGNGQTYKQKKHVNMQGNAQGMYCDYCHFTGHTRDICYKLHGYPADYKFKKKSPNVNNSHVNANVGTKNGKEASSTSSSFSSGFSGPKANYAGTSQSKQVHDALFSQEVHVAMSTMPKFTPDQYSQILKMLNKGKEVVHDGQAMAAGPLQWEGEGDW